MEWVGEKIEEGSCLLWVVGFRVGIIPVEELARDGVGQDLVNSVRTPGLDGLFGEVGGR
jgi:hypothetical protein